MTPKYNSPIDVLRHMFPVGNWVTDLDKSPEDPRGWVNRELGMLVERWMTLDGFELVDILKDKTLYEYHGRARKPRPERRDTRVGKHRKKVAA